MADARKLVRENCVVDIAVRLTIRLSALSSRDFSMSRWVDPEAAVQGAFCLKHLRDSTHHRYLQPDVGYL